MKTIRQTLPATLMAAATVAALLSAPVPARAQQEIEGLITQLRSLCVLPPATRCTRAAHDFLDLDSNGAVALGEIEAARALATLAIQEKQSTMTAQERSLLGVALLGLKYADAGRVFAAFDADGDGSLSHEEMFADFTLDQRPFAEVVEDREAVDWTGFANRFGKVGEAFVAMLPPLQDQSQTPPPSGGR